jgi:hypothetical protein
MRAIYFTGFANTRDYVAHAYQTLLNQRHPPSATAGTFVNTNPEYGGKRQSGIPLLTTEFE